MTTSLHYTAFCILVDNIYNNQNEINYFSDKPHGTKNFQTLNQRIPYGIWYCHSSLETPNFTNSNTTIFKNSTWFSHCVCVLRMNLRSNSDFCLT